MHEERLKYIHNQLTIRHGNFQEELPEQLMVAKYLSGNERVLEIGGNIGRNSLVIAHILNSNNGNNNFVSIECDKTVAEKLKENRKINNLDFFVETRAISKRKLFQKGWNTIASNNNPEGYNPVQTMTLDELHAKYNIKFDTLILDCEGAFYYIIKDMPEILDGINIIIMENDYFDISKKREIDKFLSDKGFRVKHYEAGGWGPCYYFFYEIWCVSGFSMKPFDYNKAFDDVRLEPHQNQSDVRESPNPIITTLEESKTKSFKIHIQQKPGLDNPEAHIPTVSFNRIASNNEASFRLKSSSADYWRELVINQPSMQQQFRPVQPLPGK